MRQFTLGEKLQLIYDYLDRGKFIYFHSYTIGMNEIGGIGHVVDIEVEGETVKQGILGSEEFPVQILIDYAKTLNWKKCYDMLYEVN